jgi:hypothetical protein
MNTATAAKAAIPSARPAINNVEPGSYLGRVCWWPRTSRRYA